MTLSTDSDGRAMIEAAAKRMGWTVREWRDDPDNGLTGALGRFRVIEEDENEGLYDGDEGELLACIVGAEKYHNQRVSFSLLMEDYDMANDVRDPYAVEAVED